MKLRFALPVVAYAFATQSYLYAAVDHPEVLRVNFTGDSKDNVLHKLCQKLGPQLTTKKGPMGLGIFESVDCAGNVNEKFFEPLDWRLSFHLSGSQIAIKVERKSESAFMTLAETKIDASANLAKVLEQSDFSSLIALSLLDQLPYSGVVSIEELRAQRIVGADMPSQQMQAAYQHTVIYSADTDPKDLFIVSRVLGEGDLRSSTATKTPKLSWSLNKLDTRDHFGHAWFHSSRGPNGMQRELQLELQERQSYLEDLASRGNIQEQMHKEDKPWRRTYAGIRYGISVLSSDPVIKKQTLVGLDLQHSNSWGLRFDYVAKKSVVTDGIESYAGWSRILLQKQIVEKYKIFYFDAILLKPHLGLASFDGSFPDDTTFMNPDFVTFKFTNMFTLGGTAALASYSQNYHVYAGYTLDYNFKNLTLKRPYMLSQRVDAEYRYVGVHNVRYLPSLLKDPYFSLFYQLDVFSISGEPQFTGDTGGSLSYASNFIGGGLGFVF